MNLFRTIEARTAKHAACWLLLILTATAAIADTLYKVVGPDGKITYTDQPPADPKSAKALTFSDLPASPLPPAVLKYQAELLKGMNNRLATAGKFESPGTVTLFSATWCGYCKKAKAFLQAKRISYHEYDIDSPNGALSYVEAGGKRGVPLLIADGKRLQGFSEAAYDSFFAGKK